MPMLYKNEKSEVVGFDAELAEIVFKNLGYEEVVFKEVENHAVYKELEKGTIDCMWSGFISNRADADGVPRSEKIDFSYNYMKTVQSIPGRPDEIEYFAVGFKKGSELTAKVNEQLEALAADGTIVKIASEYGVADSVITDFSDPK